MSVSNSLPPLYARWLGSVFDRELPDEPLATCSACPLIEGRAAEVTFHPTTKCCTYFPDLPSFSVGNFFLDDDPALERSRELLRGRIALGQQVTPLGIAPPASYTKMYGRRDTFGVAPLLKCPYYIDEGPGLCGIWRHRESVCSTWFCKHDRGRLGLDFWASVRRLLKRVEDRLIFHVARDLGIDEGALEVLRKHTDWTLHRELDPDYYAGLWDPWAGREIEYYTACARAVAGLDWEQVRARCGAENVDPYVDHARKMFAEHGARPDLSGLVKIRSFRRVGKEGDTTTIKTFSPFDSLVLPDRTIAAMLQTDTAPADELLAELGPAGVDRPLLERMHDLDLLERLDG